MISWALPHRDACRNPMRALSQYLLEALVDECSFDQQGDTITGVHFIKSRR